MLCCKLRRASIRHRIVMWFEQRSYCSRRKISPTTSSLLAWTRRARLSASGASDSPSRDFLALSRDLGAGVPLAAYVEIYGLAAVEHIDGLRKLLVRHKIHTIKGADGKPIVGPLSPWRESEEALGISESQRKMKVGVLRLDAEELDLVRPLPRDHAIQISRPRLGVSSICMIAFGRDAL